MKNSKVNRCPWKALCR